MLLFPLWFQLTQKSACVYVLKAMEHVFTLSVRTNLTSNLLKNSQNHIPSPQKHEKRLVLVHCIKKQIKMEVMVKLKPLSYGQI